MMEKTVIMQFDRETKGAVRYEEVGPPGAQLLRNVYLRKDQLNGSVPKVLHITVKSADQAGGQGNG